MTTDVFPDSDVFPRRPAEADHREQGARPLARPRVGPARAPLRAVRILGGRGGVVFTHSATLTTAIETLDRLRPCTFRITLNVPDSKRALPLSVTMQDPRIRVTAPEAVGGWFDTVAAEHAELKNDYEDPTSEVGVRITPQLVRLSRGEQSDEYGLTLLVEKTSGFDPDDVDTLRVYGAVWNQLSRGRRCTPTSRRFGSPGTGSARSTTPEARSFASPKP